MLHMSKVHFYYIGEMSFQIMEEKIIYKVELNNTCYLHYKTSHQLNYLHFILFTKQSFLLKVYLKNKIINKCDEQMN